MNTPNFSDIYTLYFEDVYKYLLALCHDEELAEELAQDTFFKAMKSYENFRGDCKITTWLCQIAKHSFFLYEKHRKSCVTFCDGAALMGERRKTLYYTYQLAKRKDLIL